MPPVQHLCLPRMSLRKGVEKMKKKFREAQEVILALARPQGTTEVPLEEALNRVLAQEVPSPLDLPPTDTSAMDGYALMASSTWNPPATLKVVGEAPAGCTHPPPVGPGEGVLVTTGGPIPPGADAVVKVEEVVEEGDRITINRRVEPGELINLKGQDLARGQILLSPGTTLDFRKVALLASVGAKRVKVFERPRVALMATGNELLEPGEPWQQGMLYNTNRYIVEGLLKGEGVEVDYLGILPDDPDILRKELGEALDRYPLVVTTGAVSRGKYDHLRWVLETLGVKLHITSTNIKPGHPLAFGTRGSTIFFGLPGYPSATLVNALVYLLPGVRKMKGELRPLPSTLPALAGEPFKSRKDRVYFIRVNLERQGKTLVARSAGSQLTSNYLSSALCQGLAILPEEVEVVERGQTVEVLVLEKGW